MVTVRTCIFFWIYIGWSIALLVIGAILGDISIRYRQVECVSYPSDATNQVTINEHTTNDVFVTSLRYSAVPKCPTLPCTCFTDAINTMQYDPIDARNIFLILMASLLGAILVAHLLVWWRGYWQEEPLIAAPIAPAPNGPGDAPKIIAWVLFILWVCLVLVGGLVVGLRNNQSIPGTCNRFRHKIQTGYGDNEKDSYWETEFIPLEHVLSSAANNWYVC